MQPTAIEAPQSGHHGPAHALDHAKVGMLAFLLSEAAFFSTLVFTYIYMLDQVRETARTVFSMPLSMH